MRGILEAFVGSVMKKQMRIRIFTGIITAFTIVAQLVAPAQAAYAASPNDDQNTTQSVPGQESNKVFVCKYSGTPSVGEKAQTVNSVAFQVGGSDPSQWRWPGSAFNDAQGLSYVLTWDKGQPTPNKNTCPTLAAVPVNTATVSDPCGTGNATWNLPADTTTIDWSINGSGHLIASAQPGYMFINGTLSVDFGVAPETNTTACVTKIPKPAVPIIDACGPNNIVYGTVPTNSHYSFVRNANGSITFTANTGYTFDDGTTNGTVSYTLPALQDSGILCASEAIPVPATIDPCGSGNAYWVVPFDTATVHWTFINNELIATAVGVYFTNGLSSINFGSAVDSGAKCRIDLPTAPTPIDPCGAGNASWSGLPANTSAYVWSLNAGHLAVTATADYIFTDGTTYHDYGTAPDSGDLCPAPQVVNPTCDTPGSITLPALKDDGFSYHYLVTIGLDQKTYDTSALPKVIPVTQGMQVRVMLVREDPWQTQVFNQLYSFEFLSCIDVPEQPAPADPCGTNNASWTKPEDTSSVEWTIDENRHLIATAIGSLFTNGESTIDYGAAPDSNVLCAPATPSVDVYCGLYNNDQAVLPELSENDHYSWYFYGDDETNTLYIQAVADEGYSFSKDAQTAWEFVDEHTACAMPDVQVTPKTCHADATVTVEYNTDRYYYTIQLGDGEENPLDSGTTTLTEVGTYTVRGYEYRYSNNERIMIDEEDGVAFAETFTVTAPSCEPGKGSITPLPTPIELPHTGSDGITGWIVAIISAMTVYGAVYFAQPRRS